MIFLIIGAALGLLLGFKFFQDFREDGAGWWVASAVMSLLFMMVGALLGGLIGAGIAEATLDKKSEVIGTKQIVAIKDNVVTQGSFFLGSGSVDGEAKYFAMVKTDDGLQTQDFDTSEVFIHEGNYDPHVDTTQKVFTSKYCWLLAPGCDSLSNYQYHFYIPSNSVDKTFKVDLE